LHPHSPPPKNNHSEISTGDPRFTGQPSPDGRGCVVELTPAGRAVVRRARVRKIAWLNAVLGELDEHQRQALHSAATLLDRRSL
jgi:hypothetical protein